MVVFNELLQRFHNEIGSYQITIAGEITIGNKNNTQLLMLLNEERNEIYGYMDDIRRHFPFLSVSCNENLVEISIKIFSYDKYMNRKNFLEELRAVLAGIISKINEDERFMCRLSITGTLVDRHKRSKFIMLSKQSVVEYKFVQQEVVPGISNVIFNKIIVCSVTLLAVLLIAYTIYTIAFIIPDHNPNRLLSNILETVEFDKNIFNFI